MAKNFSTAYLDAPRSEAREWQENKYNDERKALKEDLKGMNICDFDDSAVKDKLKAIAKKIVTKTMDFLPVYDVTDMCIPRIDGELGTTIEQQEIEGLKIYEGTYGAAVRMSAPLLKGFTVTTNLKELGIRINLADLQTGKYSTSLVGEYAAMLIGAFRSRLLFRTLLANASFIGAGSQVTSAPTLSNADMVTAIGKLAEDGDIKVIVGRRAGIMALSAMTTYSDQTRREWETRGQIGNYAGIPILRINSFTDPTYGGTVPFASGDLWIFSSLPAGRFMVVKDVETSNELIARSGVMNIYYRWDDGVAIWKPNRIVRLSNVTMA